MSEIVRNEVALIVLHALISKLPVIDQTGEFGNVVEDKVQYNIDVVESAFEFADTFIEVSKAGDKV